MVYYLMESSLLGKVIVAFIMLLFVFDFFRPERKKNKPSVDPAIVAADMREQYDWRYFRFIYQVIKLVVFIWFFATMIQYVLS